MCRPIPPIATQVSDVVETSESALPSARSIIAEDIRGALSRTHSLWPDLRRANGFITGGTGFFGILLLETPVAANRALSEGLRSLFVLINPGAPRQRLLT
jgi:hypothetical protein